MLLLLPPSESKCTPDAGPLLDMRALSFPALNATRRRVLKELVALSRDEPAARTALGLSAAQRDEVVQNRLLRRAPCGPAISVYSGVLYEALDPATLTTAQLRRLDFQVALASALFGLVRPLDAIPAYRLSGDSRVPTLGPLSRVWRDPLGAVLASVDGPIVDLRSSPYRALAPLPDRGDVVEARILLERDGRRTVVSHHNKAVKGRLVRAVALARRPLGSVDDLAALAEKVGLRVEVDQSRSPARLDLVATTI